MTKRPGSNAGPPTRTACAINRGRQNVRGKFIPLALIASGAFSSLMAQQPAKPAPTEPPIGAMTPTTQAIKRAQDSMTVAEAGSQEPVITLHDAIKMATNAQPATVHSETNLDIAHATQPHAAVCWL